jgi:hypothetical protein
VFSASDLSFLEQFRMTDLYAIRLVQRDLSEAEQQFVLAEPSSPFWMDGRNSEHAASVHLDPRTQRFSS